MRNPLAILDSAIERKIVVPLAQRFEAKTGRTNFYLCKIFSGAQLLGLILECVPPLNHTTDWPAVLINIFINGPLVSWIMWGCDRCEKESLRSETCGQSASVYPPWHGTFGNLFKAIWGCFAIIQIVAALLALPTLNGVLIVGIGIDLCAIAAIYFGSIPKPPKVAKKQPKPTGLGKLSPVRQLT